MTSERLACAALAVAVGACADVHPGQPYPEDGGVAAVAPGGDETTDATAGSATDAAAIAPSFAASVEPVLRDGCARCHAPGGQASGTAFVLTGKAADDHATVSRLIDPSAPASSRLLTKARGDGHGGGVIWPANSPQAQLVTQWITQGARP
jgi:hypothetical protein